MCGPTSSEKSLQQDSQSFSNQLRQNYGTLFGKQQGVLDSINRSLSPVLAGGPSQHGFTADTLAALNTGAINAAGAANKAAQQAARTYGAGEGGGGTSGVTSGITKQIESAIGSQNANALAGQQNQIVQADYAQGNANYWRAQGAEQQLAAGYSPNASQEGAISENAQSFGQAKEIQQAEERKAQMIAGGITSLATNIVAPGLGGAFKAAQAGDSIAGGFFSGLGGKQG
jgi:hypothetical protein